MAHSAGTATRRDEGLVEASLICAAGRRFLADLRHAPYMALIPLSSPVTQLPDGRVLLEQADGLTLLLEPEAAYPKS